MKKIVFFILGVMATEKQILKEYLSDVELDFFRFDKKENFVGVSDDFNYFWDYKVKYHPICIEHPFQYKDTIKKLEELSTFSDVCKKVYESYKSKWDYVDSVADNVYRKRLSDTSKERQILFDKIVEPYFTLLRGVKDFSYPMLGHSTGHIGYTYYFMRDALKTLIPDENMYRVFLKYMDTDDVTFRKKGAVILPSYDPDNIVIWDEKFDFEKNEKHKELLDRFCDFLIDRYDKNKEFLDFFFPEDF